jgi:hypothetical protein
MLRMYSKLFFSCLLIVPNKNIWVIDKPEEIIIIDSIVIDYGVNYNDDPSRNPQRRYP